jgi:hypothetical protein
MTTVIHQDEGVQGKWPSRESGAPEAVSSHSETWNRVNLFWHATMNFFVPIGYEDAAGFHYGTDPEQKPAE